MTDYQVLALGDVELDSGEWLRDAKLAYQTCGALNATRDNVIVLPAYFSGSHRINRGFFGGGRALDPARHFIVSVNLFGNGFSSSPSNSKQRGSVFPKVSLDDNIRCQHRLVSGHLGVKKIALVAGCSLAGFQAFYWASRYPDFVAAILPCCASARASPQVQVFIEGIKAVLQADARHGGLKAFARVYAGASFSPPFFRDGLFRAMGFDSIEALLRAWEDDYLRWDANDLLAMMHAWQHADISRARHGDCDSGYNGDYSAALGAIKAKTIVIACTTDRYFLDAQADAKCLSNGELRVYDSPLGHCVTTPGYDENFAAFFDCAVADLLSLKNKPG